MCRVKRMPSLFSGTINHDIVSIAIHMWQLGPSINFVRISTCNLVLLPPILLVIIS